MQSPATTIQWKRPFPFPGIPVERFILDARLRERVLAGATPIVIGRGAMKAIDGGIRGGMKAYHIHHGDQVLALDDKQWAEVTRSIVERTQQQLGHAKEISFETAAYLVGAFEP